MARLDIMRLARRAGPSRPTGGSGRESDRGSVAGGVHDRRRRGRGPDPRRGAGRLHSSAWSALVIVFVFAAVTFIGQQVTAPVQEATAK